MARQAGFVVTLAGVVWSLTKQQMTSALEERDAIQRGLAREQGFWEGSQHRTEKIHLQSNILRMCHRLWWSQKRQAPRTKMLDFCNRFRRWLRQHAKQRPRQGRHNKSWRTGAATELRILSSPFLLPRACPPSKDWALLCAAES